MKILLISPLFPWRAGLSRTKITHALLDIVSPWVSNKVKLSVIRPEPFYQHLRHFNNLAIQVNRIESIDVISIPIFKIPRSPITIYNNISKYLNSWKNDIDILIPHYYTGLGVVKTLKEMGWTQPVVFGVHMTDTWMLKRRSKYLSTPDYLAFRSYAVMTVFKNNFDLRKPYYIINSGIQRSLIKKASKSVYKNISERKIKFLTVSRLTPLKNIDMNLKAFSRLPNDFNWTYTIAGDGMQDKFLKVLATRLGIRKRVRFVGYQSHDECLNLMDKHDVFIMISAPETLGIVYLEAMARGMLVIGAKGWGIDGIISNEKNGYLVPPRNVEKLVKCIENLNLGDIEAILRSSEKTIRSLTTDKVSESYLQFIREALGETSEE